MLSDKARNRLSTVFATDDVTGKLQATWQVKEQLRTLLAGGSLADAAAAKDRLQALMEEATQPETSRLWRTVCGWLKKIEVLIVTGATTAKAEADNTAINTLNEQAADLPTHATTKRVPIAQCARTAERTPITAVHSPRTCLVSVSTGQWERNLGQALVPHHN